MKRGAFGRYLPGGQLIYVDRGTLFAAPFDLRSLRITGAPRPVVRQVAYDAGYGFAHYDAAPNGTLAYLRDPSEGLSTLQRISPEGAAAVASEPSRYLWPRLSPDGARVAYSQLHGSDYDLYVSDLRTGRATRLTSGEGGQSRPIWTRDSKWVLYLEDTSSALWAKREDGAGEAVKVAPGLRLPFDISPDGQRLAFSEMSEKTGPDIWTAPLTTGEEGPRLGASSPLRTAVGVDVYPRFSPDGRWVAYASNESGDFQIYVRAASGGGAAAVRVSPAGGRIPAWSSRSDELLFEALDNRIMSVRYRVRNGVFEADAPKLWSSVRLARTGVLGNFDISPDGKSIVALVAANVDNSWRPDHVTIAFDFLKVQQHAP